MGDSEIQRYVYTIESNAGPLHLSYEGIILAQQPVILIKLVSGGLAVVSLHPAPRTLARDYETLDEFLESDDWSQTIKDFVAERWRNAQ